MKSVVTAAQMRCMDQMTVESYLIPGVVLMENAGRGVAQLIGGLYSQQVYQVVIFCGKGNNGGDGFVIARHMHNWGANVKIILLGKGSELQGDALINYKIAKSMKLEIIEDFQEDQLNSVDFEIYDAIIDGIFGTGLTREIKGRAESVIRAINTRKTGAVFAIDVPSGLDVDTGEILGVCIEADATATYGGMKKGMLTNESTRLCGNIRVVDISVPRELYIS